VVEEALERIKAGWQDRGYFKWKLTASEGSDTQRNDVHIALFAHVDEHARYTLKVITFEHGHVNTIGEKVLSNRGRRNLQPRENCED